MAEPVLTIHGVTKHFGAVKALTDVGFTLERGEAAEFDTSTPHRMRASGTRPCEVISIFNTVGERLHLLTPTAA